MGWHEQSNNSKGRTLWRRSLQLRIVPPDIDDDGPVPVQTLAYAARNAEPPAYLHPWERDELKRRFLVLCEWLDDQPEDPVLIQRTGKDSRLVVIYGSCAYQISNEERYILSGQIANGRFEANDRCFEVGRPLENADWLKPILLELNLIGGKQGDGNFSDSLQGEIADWLAKTAYRYLLRDLPFQELRSISFPKLFEIPRDVYSIALASRFRPHGPMLDSRTMNNVWGNERAFRQVARENPQLLPLLAAYVEQIPSGETVSVKDPVLGLKQVFRNAGLSEASWRYLVRHGARIFRLPWEIARGQQALKVAIRYLEALEAAGLPPPPPPMLVKTFLNGYGNHGQDYPMIRPHFQNAIDPLVLQAGFLEADRRRRIGNMEGFAEEFLGVCWWSEIQPGFLDKKLAKAGWPWFVRRWQEAERDEIMRADTPYHSWKTRLPHFSICKTGTEVVPIRSSDDLIQESLAMRNCVRDYLDRCITGEIEIYSVRDEKTGKRKGDIGFRFDDGVPTIIDIKGFANSPPAGEVKELAYEVFGWLQNERSWTGWQE